MLLRHPTVSPVHCALVQTGEAVYLRDLFSKNGTYLNGLRAECEKLSDGDVIKVAGWEIAVEIRSPGTETLAGAGPLDLEPTPTVVALKHNGNGAVVRMRRDVNIIGRKSGADFAVQDQQASRAHALVFMLHGHPVVCDLMSENGLRVNDQLSAFSVLKSGDRLQIGATPLRVVVPSPTVQAPRQSDSSIMTAETVVRAPEAESDMIDIRSAEIRR
jgi:pSer/pThr/pTyr-binding forkhead associated (FHA) protein